MWGTFFHSRTSIKSGKTLLQLKPLEQKLLRLTKMVFKKFLIEEIEKIQLSYEECNALKYAIDHDTFHKTVTKSSHIFIKKEDLILDLLEDSEAEAELSRPVKI